MPYLSEEAPRSWIFVHDHPVGAHEKFDHALELLDSGKAEKAANELRELLLVAPDHIDALHHLALIYDREGLKLEAYLSVREATRIGLEGIPPRFSWLTSRMLWGHLENRPFMRAYHALGLYLQKTQGPGESLEIFARLVSVNPNDNLGARYLLMQNLLELGEWSSAYSLSQNYPDDSGPDIAYSKVVALSHLGLKDEALAASRLATQQSPNIAAELLKNRHTRPDSSFPGYITSGGADEAFDYWERNRTHWARGGEPFQLLKRALGK